MNSQDEYTKAVSLIDTAVSQFGLSELQAKGLKDAHEIAFRSGLDGVRYMTSSEQPILDPRDYSNVVDVSGFLRAMRRDRPELLTVPHAPVKPDVPARTSMQSKPVTLTEAFVAAKRGDNSLFDQIMANKPPEHKASGHKINLTQAMVKAKNGDRSDLDAFEKSLKA